MSTRAHHLQLHESLTRQSSSLPRSIQTVLNDCQSSVSSDQLQILASLTPNTRCDALRMRFSGVAGDVVVHHLCSAAPSRSMSADHSKKSSSSMRDAERGNLRGRVAVAHRTARHPWPTKAISHTPRVIERRLILAEEDKDGGCDETEALTPRTLASDRHPRKVHPVRATTFARSGSRGTSLTCVTPVTAARDMTHVRGTQCVRRTLSRYTGSSRAHSLSGRTHPVLPSCTNVSLPTRRCTVNQSHLPAAVTALRRCQTDSDKENRARASLAMSFTTCDPMASSSSFSLSSSAPVTHWGEPDHTSPSPLRVQEAKDCATECPERSRGRYSYIHARHGVDSSHAHRPHLSLCHTRPHHTGWSPHEPRSRSNSNSGTCAAGSNHYSPPYEKSPSMSDVIVPATRSLWHTPPGAVLMPRTPSLGTLVSVSPSSRSSSLVSAAATGGG